MVFPASYKDFSLPKYIDYTLSFLGLLKDLLFVTLFYYSGVEAFLDPDICWSTRSKTRHEILLPSPLVVLTREVLPVVKYCEIVDGLESCAVCLHEFCGGDEIRRLVNCTHVFHRECVDRWMDQEQMTCPLCRTPFVSDDMQEALNGKLWTAGIQIDGLMEY